jgi:NAD(P)-dependent dehydrogenase (short-subunit alcohol dehydrogenase family)
MKELIEELDFEAWDKAFEVNVNAPLIIAREIGL